jgi:hypothetical protein
MTIRKKLTGATILLLLLLSVSLAWNEEMTPSGRWLTGDFHNHTFLTDGGITPEEVMSHAFSFGLDWMVNSEHGGAFGRNPKGEPWPADTAFLGSPATGMMWRWQSLWQTSYPLVTEARAMYPDKLVGLGYEWNVPTHDHASVGIVGPAEDGGRAIAQHEYLFDAKDTGITADTLLGVSGKITENSHAKALAGVKWLAANYPDSSYFIINHPSRELGYSIADIRDFNNAAPLVAFGFEGIPGHQKAAMRGGYKEGPFHDATGRDITARARTYGGADLMIAKVGGTWDALLGEGRRFFTFVNSDFHTPDYDFWPGEYAKNHTYVQDLNHDGKYFTLPEVLAGMRSGDSFITTGDLVSDLEFSARSGRKKAGMGGTLASKRGHEVEITIRFRSPATNNNGDPVSVDHIDLIAGEVHHKAGKYLKDGTTRNPAYDKDTNASAKVIANFTRKEWREEGEGWRSIVYRLKTVKGEMYFRLRGTNLGRGVPGKTDQAGNPLNDDLMAPNTAAKAYADLWFYSNPVFVGVDQ